MSWSWITAGLAAAVLLTALLFGAIEPLHLPPRPKAGQKRVACVGDSITYGCFVPGQPWNNYPRRLEKLLGKAYCVGNFGYSDRAAIKSADHPYTAERLYRHSLDFQPEIVLLMLGSNDTKKINWDAAAYECDLSALIDSYLQLPSRPQLFLLLPPPVFPGGKKVLWRIQGEVLERELLPICRRVAADKALPLVDVHADFVGREELFVEGCHPNARGARLLAETVYEALIQAGAIEKGKKL